MKNKSLSHNNFDSSGSDALFHCSPLRGLPIVFEAFVPKWSRSPRAEWENSAKEQRKKNNHSYYPRAIYLSRHREQCKSSYERRIRIIRRRFLFTYRNCCDYDYDPRRTGWFWPTFCARTNSCLGSRKLHREQTNREAPTTEHKTINYVLWNDQPKIVRWAHAR